MDRWLFKTESDDYSYQDLDKEGQTIWDGVKNSWALKNLKEVKIDDIVLIYHTGKEKCIACIAKVVSDPYPDPKLNQEKFVVVDLKPLQKIENKITLKMMKTDPDFKDFMLVKFSRLSIIKIDQKSWLRLCELEPVLNHY